MAVGVKGKTSGEDYEDFDLQRMLGRLNQMCQQGLDGCRGVAEDIGSWQCECGMQRICCPQKHQFRGIQTPCCTEQGLSFTQCMTSPSL